MKQLFDDVSFKCSKLVTKNYSTSFSLAVYMLSPVIRDAIYSIYGFVRLRMKLSILFMDTIRSLITEFEDEYYKAKDRISKPYLEFVPANGKAIQYYR
jgi:hypothetical protein